MKSFILILLSIIAIQCDKSLPTMYEVDYANNANYDIYFFPADGFGGNYPDTTISFNREELGFIKKGIYVKDPNRFPIETIVKNIPSDTLSIFYFHSDTIQKYSWEVVQHKYKILQRYDLSIEDIHALYNGYGVPEIPYPPTEIMKNMKMYPSYGSK